jgi:putative hemolysin
VSVNRREDDMTDIMFEIAAIIALIIANGLFAMSELAVVAARKSRLQDWAERDSRAKAALELANNPNQFFSTVQIGITLVGILAGAFGGRTLANELASYLRDSAIIGPYSDLVAVAIVVICITYFSVVLGELVPKRIALGHAEAIARLIARPMGVLSAIAAPMVWLLTASTDTIFKAIGSRAAPEPPVTEEEIKRLVQQGAQAGVFEASEQNLIEAVIGLGDKSVRRLITPRTQIVWLEVTDPIDSVRRKISESGHSRFPVCRRSLEDVIGVIQAKDLLSKSLASKPIDLNSSLQQPVFVPHTLTALKVLEDIKRSGSHLVFVVDEYGGIEGLLTHHDILEAIAGEIPFSDNESQRAAVQRSDGSWLLDGMLAIDEFKELFHLETLPGENKDAYQTLGGFLFTQMGRVPSVSDTLEWNNLLFEIVDMDGKRIDKVFVAEVEKNPADTDCF